jgi:arylsulfatase A-like enzyme
MKTLSAWLVICLIVGTVVAAEPEQPRRPNVVVFLSDDQGWGDLSIHGNTDLATPHVDSLAKNGAMFTHFYVQPVCSPTRAEFLTGRYHPRGGVWNVSTGGERLNLDERTIADLFKSAGYATGCFGKWHNGSQYPYHPNGRGFQEYYGFTSGHWGEYFDPPLDHNGNPVKGNGYLVDDLTDHAMDFITQNKEKPFFCYVPYNTPHSPMQVPDRFYNKFRDAKLALRYEGKEKEDLDHTRAALAMCENLDWNVGRLLAKLEELHLTSNTIVIYFCDNGPNGWRWNGGMKGRKGSTDEGGVRSPLFVRWPGKIEAGTTIESLAGAIDLLPTLAELCGVPLPNGKPLDGISHAQTLLGKADKPVDRLLFAHWAGRVSVRSPRFRLDHQGQLYDLKNDPNQKKNVNKDHPEVLDQLTTAVAQWNGEVNPNQRDDPRPFTVGYSEFPNTPLPARDGVPMGQVKRSAPAPNCSFFTNWKKLDDRITWSIEVQTPGIYEVEVWYTCPKSQLGSTIEVSFGENRCTTKIMKENAPPLRGKEHDRVNRGAESYVKDFIPMSIGTMTLPAGKGTLTLRATEIAADEVMDVRGLTLRLKTAIK